MSNRKQSIMVQLKNIEDALDRGIFLAASVRPSSKSEFIPIFWEMEGFFTLKIVPLTLNSIGDGIVRSNDINLTCSDGRSYGDTVSSSLCCHYAGCTNEVCIRSKLMQKEHSNVTSGGKSSIDSVRQFNFDNFVARERKTDVYPQYIYVTLKLSERDNPEHYVECKLQFKTFRSDDYYTPGLYNDSEIIQLQNTRSFPIFSGTNSTLNANYVCVFYPTQKSTRCILVVRSRDDDGADIVFNCSSSDDDILAFKNRRTYSYAFVPSDIATFRVKKVSMMADENAVSLRFQRV